ncbi:MAG: HAD family phosphatase [Thermoplasmata archaeon]
MAKIGVLLWDVGGVLLSNGWDREARRQAAARFGLDANELERRHEALAVPLETGRLDWEGYLDRAVFYEPRDFTPGEFRQLVWDRSTPFPGAIDCARALHDQGTIRMAMLNNESRELNEFRLEKFGLRPLFDVFLSSCYTGRLKPDPEAFRLALDVTQQPAEACLFLDDRPENIEAAARLGLRTLRVRDPNRLREDLLAAGISP